MSQTIDQVHSRYTAESILEVVQLGYRILKDPVLPRITEEHLLRLDKVRPFMHDLCR